MVTHGFGISLIGKYVIRLRRMSRKLIATCYWFHKFYFIVNGKVGTCACVLLML